MSLPISVGIIGSGMAAQVFHIPVIQALPVLHLHTLVARQPAATRQRYPTVRVLTSADELFSDSQIDLVVIATPNDSHFALAKQALQAGKHVVVEKPFTVTAAEAAQLNVLAQQQQRVLTVHHNRRWDGDFLTIQRLLAAQLLGDLVTYEAHFDRFRPTLKANAWREQDRAGSGILFDLGSHLIDQAQVLFGLPNALTAQLRTERPGGQADDSFTLQLHYPRLSVTLRASMLVRETGPHFVLHGTAGSFVKYGMDVQEAALKDGESLSAAQWGCEPASQWGTLNTEVNGLHIRGQIETVAGCYPAFYQNVADAIHTNAPLAVTATQAYHTMRLLELAQQSHASGQTLVV